MAAPRKKKKLTQREKSERAALKKQMQEEGILSPDKPRLNRKKFAKEVRAEWEKTEGPLYVFVMGAISWMIPSGKCCLPITPEEVGVLKVLKIALETKKFEDALPDDVHKYNTLKFYEEVVKPIIDL